LFGDQLGTILPGPLKFAPILLAQSFHDLHRLQCKSGIGHPPIFVTESPNLQVNDPIAGLPCFTETTEFLLHFGDQFERPDRVLVCLAALINAASISSAELIASSILPARRSLAVS
jgi:hypothetical protein